jgi:hypothetical protein
MPNPMAGWQLIWAYPGKILVRPGSGRMFPRESRHAGDLAQDVEGFSFGAAVEMLARIYSSGDRQLISAINANIKAISGAIESRQREQRSTKELKDLRKRLIALEKK